MLRKITLQSLHERSIASLLFKIGLYVLLVVHPESKPRKTTVMVIIDLQLIKVVSMIKLYLILPVKVEVFIVL